MKKIFLLAFLIFATANLYSQVPPPTLLWPPNNYTQVHPDSVNIFDWSDVSGATSYRITISSNIDTIVTVSQYTVPPNTFTYITYYYWWVAAINQSGQGSNSQTFAFSTFPVTLNPPTLVSPLNNVINVSVTPSLDWLNVILATSYRVQVSTSLLFSNLIVNVPGLINSGYIIPAGLLANCYQYYWRVNAANAGGTSNWSDVWTFTTICNSGIKQISSEIPSEFKLYQNYPNPFNPSTNIKYQITNNKLTTIKVFDILGKEIETLVNEKQSPGIYEVTFDGNNLPSGIYYYTIRSGDFMDTKKMVMVK
jgi:hypothetical protein